MMKCPKCGSEKVVSTFEFMRFETIFVNNGEVYEIADMGRKLTEDVPEFLCINCDWEWDRREIDDYRQRCRKFLSAECPNNCNYTDGCKYKEEMGLMNCPRMRSKP